MHFLWIIVISNILISLGALIITAGQQQAIPKEKEQLQKLSPVLEALKSQYTRSDNLKNALEDLVKLGNTKLKELEAEAEKLQLEREQKKKKTQVDSCRAEKEIKQHEVEELAQTMKRLTETLKAESDVWSKEKETLKGQLTGYREICKYVKNNSIALKKCGTPPS